MGHIVVKARIAARRTVTTEFLIDTGATHTIIAPALAARIGAPVLPRRFEVALADGSRRRLKACALIFTVADRSAPTTALLLPGSESLLGVETLEVLGLRVNPEKQRLEPSRAQPALLVGFRRRWPQSASAH